jgi:hypothetical protein
MTNIDASLKDVYDLLLAIFTKFAQIDFQLINGLALYYISEKQFTKMAAKWKQVPAATYLEPSAQMLLVLSSLDLIVPSMIEQNCLTLLVNLSNQKKVQNTFFSSNKQENDLEDTKNIFQKMVPEYHKICENIKSLHYHPLNFSRLMHKLDQIKKPS